MLTGTERLMEDFSLEIPATPAASATSDNAMNLALPAAPSIGESLLPSALLTGSDAAATALGIFPSSGRGGPMFRHRLFQHKEEFYLRHNRNLLNQSLKERQSSVLEIQTSFVQGSLERRV